MNTKTAATFGYEGDNETPATAAIAVADAHTNNVGLPTYSELVAALRISRHHTQMAADLYRSLGGISERAGMHGTAAAHAKSATESDQAAELIRALLARIPA